MGEIQQNTINWLMICVSLIIFFIFLPFILKAINSNKKKMEEKALLTEVNRAKLSEIETAAVTPKVKEKIILNAEVEQTLSTAMSKTKENMFGRIKNLFISNEIAALEEIEEILYTSDIGPQTVTALMTKLDEDLSRAEKKNLSAIKDSLKKEILNIFNQVPENIEAVNAIEAQDLVSRIKWNLNGPTIIMIVGVNGAGKTTTIGKLSAYFASLDKKILVAAGDTFRAAAQSQLKVWTDRAQVEVFAPEGINDPSAVAYDAVAKAKAQNYDLVMIDTAGRLHTQTNLMEELKKVKRVIQKNIPEAPHEVIIVLDANSGQNALIQAKEFNSALGLTGVILTKMDGTAKGGVAIGITNELKVPIKLIGIGEKISDLKPFSSKEYIDSIFN